MKAAVTPAVRHEARHDNVFFTATQGRNGEGDCDAIETFVARFKGVPPGQLARETGLCIQSIRDRYNRGRALLFDAHMNSLRKSNDRWSVAQPIHETSLRVTAEQKEPMKQHELTQRAANIGPEPVFLSATALLDRLPVSRRTLHNWMKDGTIPYIKTSGRRVLFDWPSVRAALLRKQRGG